MISHVRNVRILCVLFGAVLLTWAIFGLVTESHSSSVVTSWLIVLVFSVALVVVGVTFGRTRVLGKALLWAESGVFTLYTMAWLFLGGIEDAGGYWSALVLGVGFVSYATYVSFKRPTG